MQGHLSNKLQSYVNLFHIGLEAYNEVKQNFMEMFLLKESSDFQVLSFVCFLDLTSSPAGELGNLLVVRR